MTKNSPDRLVKLGCVMMIFLKKFQMRGCYLKKMAYLHRRLRVFTQINKLLSPMTASIIKNHYEMERYTAIFTLFGCKVRIFAVFCRVLGCKVGFHTLKKYLATVQGVISSAQNSVARVQGMISPEQSYIASMQGGKYAEQSHIAGVQGMKYESQSYIATMQGEKYASKSYLARVQDIFAIC